jgi:hypothetical protein
MGGGSSSPEYMKEIRLYSNDKAKEKFENKITNNNKYFLILLLIILCLLIFYFYKNRYKD